MRTSRPAHDAGLAPARPAAAGADPTVACPHCGTASPWGALARVDVLDGDALAHHLAVPPVGWFVDVRACGRCGAAFARKALSARPETRAAGG
jgi:hypothetical protein